MEIDSDPSPSKRPADLPLELCDETFGMRKKADATTRTESEIASSIGNNMFTHHKFVETQMHRIFGDLEDAKQAAGLSGQPCFLDHCDTEGMEQIIVENLNPPKPQSLISQMFADRQRHIGGFGKGDDTEMETD